MKLHNYIIIFCAVIFSVYIFYDYVNQRTITYEQTNQEYANALTTACHDAAKTINKSVITENTGVWSTKDDQIHTLYTFYSTLSRNFGSTPELLEEKMKEKTPFVVLVDVDGFYISYNAKFDEYNNANILAAFEGPNVITGLNTWAEKTTSGHIVRYYLSDYVEVTSAGNHLYTGDRNAVAASMASAGELSSDLSFLTDDTKFASEKNSTIINKIETQLNYYVNTQMINVSKYFTGYTITLPQLTKEEWSRMLKNPTVISFMQGSQQALNSNMLNVYAYAAGELTSTQLYFIDNGYYYPCNGNVTETIKTVTKNGITTTAYSYEYNGVPVENLYSSMEECAALGALPGKY